MILDKILATKHAEVAQLREARPLRELAKQIEALPACRGFVRALCESPRRSIGLIAEVKKASPSKGIIRADFEPVALAQTYEAAGADCLSVLTDVQYFQGANDYLSAIRAHVALPLLRKDFIVDEHQIFEARAIGADAILLIAAALNDREMRDFNRRALDLGMDVLVEVHNREELERALQLDLRLIGVNNRDLKTFVTDLRVTEALLKYVPAGLPLVSESGIASAADVHYLQSLGARALLIGETFMRRPDVAQAVHELLGPL